MNFKGIFVIMIIVFVVAIVALLPNNPRNTPPPIMDDLEPAYDYTIEIGTNVITTKNQPIENQTASFFYKNGTKHYVIEAKDEVTIDD